MERNSRVVTGLDVKGYGPQINNSQPTLTQQVNKISSQQAPKLRQQTSKPRAYDNEEQQHPKLRAYGYEEAATTKSLSPELTATKTEQQPKLKAYGYGERTIKNERQEATTLRTKTTRTTIMNKEETPDREQTKKLSLNDITVSTCHQAPWRQHHEALQNRHASSENTTDLLKISRIQEQDNMSTPVKLNQELPCASTSTADRTREDKIPEVSATPKTPPPPPPPPGPDPGDITMAEIQAMLDTYARDITDDLINKETDAVRNLQIQFNEQQQVKSNKAAVKDDPDKTTGQTQQPSIYSTCIRTNENCNKDNTKYY